MVIGCGLMLMSALSGVNTVIFYSTTIFDFAGFHESNNYVYLYNLCIYITLIYYFILYLLWSIVYYDILFNVNIIVKLLSICIFIFVIFVLGILATASVGAVNFFTTMGSSYFIDSLGRKTLLMLGMYCMLGNDNVCFYIFYYSI